VEKRRVRAHACACVHVLACECASVNMHGEVCVQDL
jgi:hypothetical protein